MQVDESGKVVDLARNNSVVGVAVRGAAGYDLLQVKPGEQQHLTDCPVDGSRLEWFKATLRKPGSPAVANPGPVESPGIVPKDRTQEPESANLALKQRARHQ